MFFTRTDKNEEPLKRIMREYLFDDILMVAANAFAGRRLSGLGLINLRSCALDGPAMRLMGEGFKISYQWISKDDAASPHLQSLILDLGSNVIGPPSSPFRYLYANMIIGCTRCRTSPAP